MRSISPVSTSEWLLSSSILPRLYLPVLPPRRGLEDIGVSRVGEVSEPFPLPDPVVAVSRSEREGTLLLSPDNTGSAESGMHFCGWDKKPSTILLRDIEISGATGEGVCWEALRPNAFASAPYIARDKKDATWRRAALVLIRQIQAPSRRVSASVAQCCSNLVSSVPFCSSIRFIFSAATSSSESIGISMSSTIGLRWWSRRNSEIHPCAVRYLITPPSLMRLSVAYSTLPTSAVSTTRDPSISIPSLTSAPPLPAIRRR